MQAMQNPATEPTFTLNLGHEVPLVIERTKRGIVAHHYATGLTMPIDKDSPMQAEHLVGCRAWGFVVGAKRTSFDLTNADAFRNWVMARRIPIYAYFPESEEVLVMQNDALRTFMTDFWARREENRAVAESEKAIRERAAEVARELRADEATHWYLVRPYYSTGRYVGITAWLHARRFDVHPEQRVAATYDHIYPGVVRTVATRFGPRPMVVLDIEHGLRVSRERRDDWVNLPGPVHA